MKRKKMQRKRKKSISTITEDFLKNDHIYTWISSDIFFKATRKGGVYLLFQYNHIPAKSKKNELLCAHIGMFPALYLLGVLRGDLSEQIIKIGMNLK